jgi:hypothetical protein
MQAPGFIFEAVPGRQSASGDRIEPDQTGVYRRLGRAALALYQGAAGYCPGTGSFELSPGARRRVCTPNGGPDPGLLKNLSAAWPIARGRPPAAREHAATVATSIQ